MAVQLRKPILVVGIALSFGWWFWDSVRQSAMEVGEWSVLGLIVLGTGLWLLQRKASPNYLSSLRLSPLKRETVESAIAQAQTMLTYLETEAPTQDISQLKQQLTQLPDALNRQNLQLTITGGRKVGKTTLKQRLESENLDENIHWVETEALLTEDDKDTAVKQVVLASDLVLFLTTGDLTDSQWQILQHLRASHQRVLLLFNKQDHYLPEERAMLLQQLRQRVQEIIYQEDVLAISASPLSVKVRQHQEDGSVQEWMEQPSAEIKGLSDRIKQILTQEREQLVWGNTWRSAIEIQKTAKAILNQVRRDRALPLIEQYQWIAAAAAFANPVSALDLLATAAINAQMLVDLSGIYQQKFSLSQAQTSAGTLGKLMVQLGLVELSTQTISSLLKSNALTYVAGGAVQGVSAAYLTRLAGLSLIEYFQEQEISTAGLNWNQLGQKLKQVFERNQRSAFLQQFVKGALTHLTPKSPQAETIIS